MTTPAYIRSAVRLAVACVLAAGVTCATVAAQAADDAVAFTPRERALIFTLSPALPPARDATNRVDGTPAAIRLGQRLFFDTRLSGSGRFACASCHEPARGWTDGRPVAVAAGTGRRNTPSLWNVAGQRWLFWDGRADSLWSQALKPIETNVELDGSRLQVVRLVAADAVLRREYESLFGPLPEVGDAARFPARGGPLSTDEAGLRAWWGMRPDDRDAVNRVFANVGKAIAAFEGALWSGPSRFDRFVTALRAGDTATAQAALSPAAQRGLATFIGRGNCVLCHAGPLLSNLEFHDIRLPRPGGAAPDDGRQAAFDALAQDEFITPGPYSDDPVGRRAQQLFYLDAQAGSRGHFRTPSLRNVAVTAPYMHAGQFATLRDVVQHYNRLENAGEPADPAHVETLIRPLGLSDTEVDEVVAFLAALTSDDAIAPRVAAPP